MLAYLSWNRGINQAGLAELLEIEPITLSRHLDKMEEAGWVVRTPDPNDRRVRLLHPSEEALGVLTRMKHISRCILDEALEGLPGDRRQLLTESLQHIRAALAAKPAADDDSELPDIPRKRNTK